MRARLGEERFVGLLDGKVAFVTGAARGQGRSHAVRLAREGASVIATDIAVMVSAHTTYAPATEADLKETAGLLEHVGRPVIVDIADDRGLGARDRLLTDGVQQLGGRLDVVVANAGICNWGRFWEMSEQQWLTMVDVNLSGVWRTMKTAVPHMISAGNGGSMIT